MMKTILAIDSATEFCSAALLHENKVYSRGSEAPRKHADLLLPYVDEVLGEAGITLSQVDALAVGRGPGSFTGVRIAAGIAQGLGFSQSIPLIGVSSLQTMAQQAYEELGETKVAAAIDARMGEVYWGTCELTEGQNKQNVMCLVGQELVCAPQDVPRLSGRWAAVGTGWETYQSDLQATLSDADLCLSGIRLPQARYMLPAAVEALSEGKEVEAEQFDVHYVRNEVTWKKLPGRE